MKRKLLCYNYDKGGLKMVDSRAFAQGQKLVWAKMLLDDTFSCPWKSCELQSLSKFHDEDTKGFV